MIIRGQDLAAELSVNDQARYDVVSRSLKDQVLARLRRETYLSLPPYQKYLPHTFEIAHLLCGPSYISLESALSYHGIIPEAVYTSTSACMKRSKTIETFLGPFRYLYAHTDEFTLGVKRIQDVHAIYFLATP